jgi:hypothetical protein
MALQAKTHAKFTQIASRLQQHPLEDRVRGGLGMRGTPPLLVNVKMTIGAFGGGREVGQSQMMFGGIYSQSARQTECSKQKNPGRMALLSDLLVVFHHTGSDRNRTERNKESAAFFDWKPDSRTKATFAKYGVPYAAIKAHRSVLTIETGGDPHNSSAPSVNGED